MLYRTGFPRCRSTATAVLLAVFCAAGIAAQERVRHADGRTLVPGLPTSTPEAQGMDSRRLAEGIDYLLANKYDYRVHGAVVIRNGRVVVDARFYPFARGERHDLASVNKSLMAILVGIAIEDGHLGLHDRLLDFFPDKTIANVDGRKEAITIEHLLAMRAGFECDPTNSEATLTAMTLSPDWVQFALDLPMAEEPGHTWVYCSPNVHLLSAILERATGTDTVEFARRHLFRHLAIGDLQWLRDPQGLARGWGDLHLGTTDMAKLGQLYLDGGSWYGRPIVSRSWTEAATTTPPGMEPPAGWPEGDGYGYLWFFGPDFVSAEGRAGQLVFVFPDDEVVIALNAGGGIGTEGSAVVWEFFNSYVRGAIVSEQPLAPNPDGLADLQAAIAAAALSDEGPPQPVPPPPQTQWMISGRTYQLDPNPSLITTMRLTFSGVSDEARFEATLPEMAGGPVLDAQVGLDGVSRFSPARHGCPAAVKGGWETDNQFVVLIDEIGLITYWRISLTFVDDRVGVQMDCLAGEEPSWTFEGTAQ
jgi:CubicO group peptidase (beta-lactamase class C family)